MRLPGADDNINGSGRIRGAGFLNLGSRFCMRAYGEASGCLRKGSLAGGLWPACGYPHNMQTLLSRHRQLLFGPFLLFQVQCPLQTYEFGHVY